MLKDGITILLQRVQIQRFHRAQRTRAIELHP